MQLLTVEERTNLRVQEAFAPLEEHRPLQCDPYTRSEWETAVKSYESKLGPVEQHIAGKLRQQVAASSSAGRPMLLLRRFHRFRHLMARPTIRAAMATERETLLAELTGFVEQLDGEFESRSSPGSRRAPPQAGRNMSQPVTNIVWGQQLQGKVSTTFNSAREQLGDIQSFSDFREAAWQLLDKVGKWLRNEVQTWVDECVEGLRDGDFSLSMSGKLMEIDTEGNMKVNYSERLVVLLREVRQLSELGFADQIPKSVIEVAVEGEKFYRYGVMLKKTANFYNTMDAQIIPSQKPLLFDALVTFDERVQAKSRDNRGGGGGSRGSQSVTWSDPSECAEYVNRLQQAADRLASENRKLRKVHMRMSEEVVSLINIDLLRQRERWKGAWVGARDMLTSLANKYPAEHVAKWRLHWDHQMYKALEANYRMGLESLNEHLTEIRADLVFSQRRLQFRPPIEELRANYYREMKKFISIPNNFSGFGNGEVYKKMADRNAESLIQVYVKAEQLFSRLLQLAEGLEDWVMLAAVPDLDEFVEKTVTEVPQWEANFKALKTKRKALEKVKDVFKVDCVTVSSGPFKAAVEDSLQRLGDALIITLRRSTVKSLTEVEAFLEASMGTLGVLPQSIEEIGNSKKELQSIVDAKPAMRTLSRDAEEKKKLLLASIGGGLSGSVDLAEVTVRLGVLPDQWENLEIAIEAFDTILEEAKEKMKGEVDRAVVDCNMELDKFGQRWQALKPKELSEWSDEAVQNIFLALAEWRLNFDEIKASAERLKTNCEHFQMSEPKFDGLDAVAADLDATEGSWKLYEDYSKDLNELGVQDWITFRTKLFDAQDLVAKWVDTIKQRARDGNLDSVTEHISHQLDKLRKALPALKFMRGEPYKEEHWSQLFMKLKFPRGVRLESLTFSHFLGSLDLVVENAAFAKDMTARAQGEVTIREALLEIKAWGETAEVLMLGHEEMGRETPLIREWKDLFTDLGDHQSLLGSLKDSPYFKPFADQAAQYEGKFALLDEVLHGLNTIQRKWVYLEPIFGRGALPQEAGRFHRVDEEFRDIMLKLRQDATLLNLADDLLFPRLRESTATMLDQLERCQKALSDFLEEKRSHMPRFYFIGDDDLLEILGQAQNPTVIQAHLKKLFQGVSKVEFSEDKSQVTALCSVAGEVVPLETPVVITEQVEVWLSSLSTEMKMTLKVLVQRCVKAIANNADGMIDAAAMQTFPSQVLCVAAHVSFATACERAIMEGGAAMGEQIERMRRHLDVYTSQDMSGDPLSRLKIKSLVLELIHNIEVAEMLAEKRVSGLEDWAWQKQLRFYLNGNGACLVRMVNAEFNYTYEYQGNSGKLVHTALTDKCYLTLTQGMHMGYGGNPYGPAGTGKTESVKALGGLLARQVLVFNCDEGIDFQSMGRIFTGLVKCGAWGCFDEFNRLKEDQLSAVSQQIQAIQAAIKDKSPHVRLVGKQIDVDHNAGIFVTMNPAGKHYGGRSKLPDNLKQLFRPVAMSKPDMDAIASTILYSEGFRDSTDLGHKLVSVFALSKQLLSQQQHYDWNLRAMKAVLNTGGKLIQQRKAAVGQPSLDDEREILIKAVRVNTLSKLTFNDSNRFLALLGDVFPGVKSEDISYPELEAAIREVMTNKPFNLEVDEGQILKMVQLKESLDQRMGCIIVGPSGCGKSTVWRVLRAALVKCGQPVKVHVMNPKSMPRERLLGHMDMDTREWTDGVLTDAARQVVKEPQEVRSWIVCDGDVDPEWIESLNSVLDDSRLLTMPNGERISFQSNVNFLFETHDLRFASPATVSRMGMIFLSDEDVDVNRLVKCWLDKQPEEQRSMLESLISDYFHRSLDWIRRDDGANFVVETTLVGAVTTGLSHLQGTTTQAQFLCGLVRGLGSNLDEASRVQFAKELFGWAGERLPDLGAPLDCYADGQTLCSYVSKTELEGEAARLEEAVLQTVTLQRNLSVIGGWVDRMEPFILVGPEGCGKNMLLRYVLSLRRSTSVVTLHCNAQTTAAHVIQRIQQACSLYSTNAGRVYRPRDTERVVLYLKDINLPKPDQYDTCMLIAFLQQLITFEGFYDENLEFLGLERIHIVASMNPATTVGRHPLSTRFTAICHIAAIDYPTQAELQQVMACFLETALLRPDFGNGGGGGEPRIQDARWQQASNLKKLAATMVDLYDQTKAKFSVDDHRHYLFTPRDLQAWVLGLLQYDVANEELLDIVTYEAQRLFRDRMVDADSEGRFDGILNGLLRSQWRHTANIQDTFFATLGNSSAGGGGGGGGESKMVGGESKTGSGGGASSGGGAAGRLGRLGVSDLSALIKEGMTYYEREERELHILLFPEVIANMSRLDRVLSKEGGSLLLVGRSGVGRRTCTSLIAYMHRMQFFSPNVSVGYGVKQFHAELKQILHIAGVQGEKALLYIEDHQIVSESILEITNSLLSAGEVPGLYTHEELEPLLAPLREIMADVGGFRTPYEFFVSRVRRNLHLVLSMDPSDPRFHARCESNPALYNRCNIVWMGDWNRNTMRELPAMLLPDMFGDGSAADDDDDLLPGFDDGGKEADEDSGRRGGDGGRTVGLLEQVITIHDSCNRNGMSATPRDYIAFLQSYKALYDQKQQKLELEVKHLESGLSKLKVASETVDTLSANANEQTIELEQKQKLADVAMDEITNTLESASHRRKEVEGLREQAKEDEAECAVKKVDIEKELSGIQPILDSAKKAIGDIKSDNLNEIRSLKMPPEPIHDVLSAVLMLLGIRDTSWLSMKKFLAKRGVKDDILNFDARRISKDIQKQVSRVLRQKASSFDDATIYRVSVAAAPMAAWVKANVRYSLVLEKIQPLQRGLDDAERVLQQSARRLEECMEELAGIDDKVSSLKDEFKQRTREAEQLKNSLEQTQITLDKAQALLGKLSGEQERWDDTVKELKLAMETLPAHILVAAGFNTYLAKSSEDVRMKMLDEWTRVCNVDRFNYRKLLSSESELLTWKAEGLPADDLSMENAIVIVNSGQLRCPFIIDPAQGATAWLQRHLGDDKANALAVVPQSDAQFTMQVELAVRFGKTLLVTECDRVDPMLYPLIRRDLKHAGPRLAVQIGDKVIDFNEKFRLFLATRNPDPDIPPDAASMITEVNFTVTRSGLEGQLLGVTIQNEQPELEQQKSEMLAKEEDFKVQLAALETELLRALAESEGNILDNLDLVDTLTKTKTKSAEIKSALEESAKASEELDRQRESFRTFARDGSRMFFLIKALQNVNNMYQFSIASFVDLFKQTLSQKMDDVNRLEERLRKLTPVLEKRVLAYVGRSLFKDDQLMFALHLVHEMHPDLFQESEWEVLIGDIVAGIDVEGKDGGGGGSGEGKDGGGSVRGLPSWAAPERGPSFTLLSTTFPRLVGGLSLHDTELWGRWGRSAECEKEFSAKLGRGLSYFQRVLVVQALRPDRLLSALNLFVCEVLNVPTTSPPPMSLGVLAESETDSTTPILMISTAGCDPSKELEELAKRTIGSEHYHEIAMGGGQSEAAVKLLRDASSHGDWLCMKNLHLVITWLPDLEKEISQLKPHENFRLWLTTESHASFPPILLQTSLKITFEAPPGLKKNLQRTYAGWDDQFIADGLGHSGGGMSRPLMFYLLAWFHAVVQERRTYIPQGWTKAYEFSIGDLRAGASVIDLAVKQGKNGVPDWPLLHGLMINAVYGGRVDNTYDTRVLMTYLKEYFNADVCSGGPGATAAADRGLALPPNSAHCVADFEAHIEGLPDNDTPTLFGLPDNIERARQRTASSAVITQLKALSLSGMAGSKFDREKWRQGLGPIIEMWKNLKSSSPAVDSRPDNSGGRGGANASPMEMFVVSEMGLAYEIVVSVDATIEAIKQVVYGTGLLTPMIQSAATELLAGRVPGGWMKRWEGPEKVRVCGCVGAVCPVERAGWCSPVVELSGGVGERANVIGTKQWEAARG